TSSPAKAQSRQAISPPGNNRLPNFHWTANLSAVSFAPHAAEFSCSWRRRCHHVGSKFILFAQSSPFFGRSGRVQPRLFSPCFFSCLWIYRERNISFAAGELRTGLEVIANQPGKRLDEDNPILHAQLPDGSR